MKTGTSSLNANAPSYVPLSRRGGVAGENTDLSTTTKGSGVGSHPESINLNQNSAVKSTTSHGFYASSSKKPIDALDKDFLEEDYDMDMAYLQMQYPGFSDECLSHIYLASRGDLENTVDILNQFELHSSDSPDLPDTLEIGDTSEPRSSKEYASSKLKGVADELAAGSFGPSNQHPPPN